MRRAILATVAALTALTAVGCGGNETVINTSKLTDEQIQKMREDDQRVFEEEGGKPGKGGAAKPGAKK